MDECFFKESPEIINIDTLYGGVGPVMLPLGHLPQKRPVFLTLPLFFSILVNRGAENMPGQGMSGREER